MPPNSFCLERYDEVDKKFKKLISNFYGPLYCPSKSPRSFYGSIYVNPAHITLDGNSRCCKWMDCLSCPEGSMGHFG